MAGWGSTRERFARTPSGPADTGRASTRRMSHRFGDAPPRAFHVAPSREAEGSGRMVSAAAFPRIGAVEGRARDRPPTATSDQCLRCGRRHPPARHDAEDDPAGEERPERSEGMGSDGRRWKEGKRQVGMSRSCHDDAAGPRPERPIHTQSGRSLRDGGLGLRSGAARTYSAARACRYGNRSDQADAVVADEDGIEAGGLRFNREIEHRARPEPIRGGLASERQQAASSRMIIWPVGSMAQICPGRTRVVVVASSTRAGPKTVWPGRRPSRR